MNSSNNQISNVMTEPQICGTAFFDDFSIPADKTIKTTKTTKV